MHYALYLPGLLPLLTSFLHLSYLVRACLTSSFYAQHYANDESLKIIAPSSFALITAGGMGDRIEEGYAWL